MWPKCLLTLILTYSQVLSLSSTDNKTFQYGTQLIGPGLRPEEPERCITADMCAPIFPNTHYPFDDREPLKPRTGPFPFSNCYHWFGPGMRPDIRIWNDDRTYTAEERVSLPADQQVKMERLHGCDVWRSFRAQQARDAPDVENMVPKADAVSPTADAPQEQGPASSSPPVRSNSPSLPPIERGDELLSPDTSNDYCESVCGSEYSSGVSYYPSSEELNRSAEALGQADIFGLDYNERDELIPIANVWPDVGAQFKDDDDVPNPLEFLKQYNELVRYVLPRILVDDLVAYL